ncbi:hypothetical protein F2P79_018467 [Pimephales promelas]|nr:hypothetical protein F2P79_018467 [Pimephales promelas]
MVIQTRNIVILLALLLASTLAEEDPEPIFKELGGELEMGFCFGDDIAVYRLTAGKKELLGQYSKPLISPPDAFKGRINTSNEGLLGLKITNLQFSDSGIYIRECWSGNTMEHYRKHYLYMCNEEFGSQEILLTPGTGDKVLLQCDFMSLPEISDKVDKISVLWYRNTVEDSGMYWCVVLLDKDEDYDDNDTDFSYDGEDDELYLDLNLNLNLNLNQNQNLKLNLNLA